jgi:hypothetical protein
MIWSRRYPARSLRRLEAPQIMLAAFGLLWHKTASLVHELHVNRETLMAKLDTSTGAKEFKVVSPKEWIKARKELLAKEKEFNRLRDELSQERRELPWEKVEKEYVFVGPNGKETLAQLFDDSTQLIVYHFMFAPEWEAGCPSCSFWADNFNGIDVHLKHRDTSFVAISRAPYEKLALRKNLTDSLILLGFDETCIPAPLPVGCG